MLYKSLVCHMRDGPFDIMRDVSYVELEREIIGSLLEIFILIVNISLVVQLT